MYFSSNRAVLEANNNTKIRKAFKVEPKKNNKKPDKKEIVKMDEEEKGIDSHQVKFEVEMRELDWNRKRTDLKDKGSVHQAS